MTLLHSAMPPSSLQLYRRLLGVVRPHWRVFALGLLAMSLTAATEPFLPALLKPLLDNGFTGKSTMSLWVVPAALIGLFATRGIFSFTASYAMAYVSNKVLTDLRSAMFQRLLQLPSPFYQRESSGQIMSRIVIEVNNVTGAATSVLTTLVKDSLVVLGLLGWLLFLNWRLTLITLLLIPLSALVVRAFSKRLRRLNREQAIVTGDLTSVVQEAVDNQKMVKIYGGQSFEAARFSTANERLRRFAMRITVAASGTVPITQLLASLAVSAVITTALVQAQNNQTTIGGFVSFITAMLMLLAPLKSLADVNAPLQRGLAAAERVFAWIDEPVEEDDGRQTFVGNRARGAIRFVGVSLRYPGMSDDALYNLNLEIPAGQTVALVGVSGGGKTSLVNLLPRFYAPTAGQIFIDDVPLTALKLTDLRAQIALVSQDITLFNDSIAANIAYGRNQQASREQIEQAARAAHLWSFIESLPEGLDTMVGENGTRLSGGQRQRVAMARAMLKDAPILILDEATSALDAESERAVQAALETLMQGRTTLVIAHRLSTIEHADRIVVLKRGQLVESGTHAELLAAEGNYAHLYRIQFASHRIEPS